MQPGPRAGAAPCVLEQAILEILRQTPGVLTLQQLQSELLGRAVTWTPEQLTEGRLIDLLSLLGLRGKIEVVHHMAFRLRP